MQLKTETVDLACGIGLLVLLVAGALAVAASGAAALRAVTRQNAIVTKRMHELQKAQTVLAQLDLGLRRNQTALAQLKRRLPESQSMGEFLAALDVLMRSSGVDLRNVTPGSVVQEELCSRMPLRFSCHGAFAGLHQVLYRLETQERIVRVDQVLISQGEEPGHYAMDVFCRVYGR